ncbi:unnamed protein product [Pedinophyceae sp. YPF-701]|nr:unnamed protein product [Pedinophyceae sp. YPF-701]
MVSHVAAGSGQRQAAQREASRRAGESSWGPPGRAGSGLNRGASGASRGAEPGGADGAASSSNGRALRRDSSSRLARSTSSFGRSLSRRVSKRPSGFLKMRDLMQAEAEMQRHSQELQAQHRARAAPSDLRQQLSGGSSRAYLTSPCQAIAEGRMSGPPELNELFRQLSADERGRRARPEASHSRRGLLSGGPSGTGFLAAVDEHEHSSHRHTPDDSQAKPESPSRPGLRRPVAILQSIRNMSSRISAGRSSNGDAGPSGRSATEAEAEALPRALPTEKRMRFASSAASPGDSRRQATAASETMHDERSVAESHLAAMASGLAKGEPLHGQDSDDEGYAAHFWTRHGHRKRYFGQDVSKWKKKGPQGAVSKRGRGLMPVLTRAFTTQTRRTSVHADEPDAVRPFGCFRRKRAAAPEDTRRQLAPHAGAIARSRTLAHPMTLINRIKQFGRVDPPGVRLIRLVQQEPHFMGRRLLNLYRVLTVLGYGHVYSFTVAEVVMIFNCLGLVVSESIVYHLLAEMDMLPETSRVSRDEFALFYLVHEERMRSEHALLEDAFRVFDIDGSGKLSVGEISSTLKDLGDMITPREAAAFMHIMQKMDRDSDSTLTFGEFIATHIEGWELMERVGQIPDHCLLAPASTPFSRAVAKRTREFIENPDRRISTDIDDRRHSLEAGTSRGTMAPSEGFSEDEDGDPVLKRLILVQHMLEAEMRPVPVSGTPRTTKRGLRRSVLGGVKSGMSEALLSPISRTARSMLGGLHDEDNEVSSHQSNFLSKFRLKSMKSMKSIKGAVSGLNLHKSLKTKREAGVAEDEGPSAPGKKMALRTKTAPGAELVAADEPGPSKSKRSSREVPRRRNRQTGASVAFDVGSDRGDSPPRASETEDEGKGKRKGARGRSEVGDDPRTPRTSKKGANRSVTFTGGAKSPAERLPPAKAGDTPKQAGRSAATSRATSRGSRAAKSEKQLSMAPETPLPQKTVSGVSGAVVLRTMTLTALKVDRADDGDGGVKRPIGSRHTTWRSGMWTRGKLIPPGDVSLELEQSPQDRAAFGRALQLRLVELERTLRWTMANLANKLSNKKGEEEEDEEKLLSKRQVSEYNPEKHTQADRLFKATAAVVSGVELRRSGAEGAASPRAVRKIGVADILGNNNGFKEAGMQMRDPRNIMRMMHDTPSARDGLAQKKPQNAMASRMLSAARRSMEAEVSRRSGRSAGSQADASGSARQGTASEARESEAEASELPAVVEPPSGSIEMGALTAFGGGNRVSTEVYGQAATADSDARETPRVAIGPGDQSAGVRIVSEVQDVSEISAVETVQEQRRKLQQLESELMAKEQALREKQDQLEAEQLRLQRTQDGDASAGEQQQLQSKVDALSSQMQRLNDNLMNLQSELFGRRGGGRDAREGRSRARRRVAPAPLTQGPLVAIGATGVESDDPPTDAGVATEPPRRRLPQVAPAADSEPQGHRTPPRGMSRSRVTPLPPPMARPEPMPSSVSSGATLLGVERSTDKIGVGSHSGRGPAISGLTTTPEHPAPPAPSPGRAEADLATGESHRAMMLAVGHDVVRPTTAEQQRAGRDTPEGLPLAMAKAEAAGSVASGSPSQQPYDEQSDATTLVGRQRPKSTQRVDSGGEMTDPHQPVSPQRAGPA